MIKNRLKRCPPHYQARLEQAGGLNRYGGANFILVWGQRWTNIEGGIWDSGDYYFRGYRQVVEDGRPIWLVKQWFPPEFYGSPALWYAENRCAKSGLQLLGDFPWHGRFETVQPLIWKGIVNGRLEIETMPLSGMIVDVLIPMIKEWTKVAWWRKEIAFREWQAAKEREFERRILDRRGGAKMAFRGPVSYSRQTNRTSLIDRRMRAIEQAWERAAALLHQQGLGITIH